MHHTQDKEFDQLFKDRFEEARWEPSAGLWDNIEQELYPAVKKRRLFYWIPAAAVLLMVAAALLWFGKEEKVRLSTPMVMEPPVLVQPLREKPLVPAKNTVGEQGQTHATVLKEEKKLLAVQVAPEAKTADPVRQLEATTPAPKAKQLEVDIPKEKPVLAMGKIEDSNLAQDAELLSQPDQVINENTQAHKKGIRNLGDLINFVVDKVDKREQKLLKFKTDDDDQSSLVAVNIGFIKFNSKKHK